MADSKSTSKSVASPAKKNYRALGNILGGPISEDADASTKRITPHKLYRKGSTIPLGEKDAARLLALGAVAAPGSTVLLVEDASGTQSVVATIK
jgi:hypothetical protein